jgi:POT family proton-dependent oligopeptide transporter
MDAGLKLIIIAWTAVAIWIGLIIFSQRNYHPKALFVLFFAEMWERFSFYGMRALLILYLSKELFSRMDQGLADSRSYGIYGAYNALLYAAPVIGGLLADRILGYRYAILIGGITMALGQFTLASTIGNEVFFFIGLAMIAVGNGFFKPNISSYLGTFYDKNDPKKDSAFTIFYMGINVGAFLAPITCGYLGEKINWSFGFLAAGLGMVLGLIVFWKNMRVYENKGIPPADSKTRSFSSFGIPNFWLVMGGIILAIPVFALLIDVEKITGFILIAAGILCLSYLLWVAFNSENKNEGRKLVVIVILFFFHMIFWAMYEQAGGSINILTDRYINRHGIETSQFQAVPAMFIVLLAPLFSLFWVKLRKHKMDPYTPVKFFWALCSISVAYIILVIGARSVIGTDKLIPLFFLVIMYLFHTMGELSISPVGLSVVTKLSPGKIAGFVMGLWFLSIALGHKIAGFLGQLIAIPGNHGNKTAELQAFTGVYMTWGVYVVLGSAVVILALTPLIRKWMDNIH